MDEAGIRCMIFQVSHGQGCKMGFRLSALHKTLPAQDLPELSPSFYNTFTNALVDANGIKIHTVIGGSGKPLLLHGGWPQTWYCWRLMLPALAQKFTVIAVDPRGSGLSDKPVGGYDQGTLAQDMIGLMSNLGFDTFDMVGYDIGMWVAYAMAVDHPGHIERLVVTEAIIPGVSPSPPLLGDRRLSDFLWHFNFNRAFEINERMVEGREDLYFGHQFASKAATPRSIPPYAVKVYVDALKASPQALRASFEYYRAIDQDIEQNARRKLVKVKIPILAVGGATACGDGVANEMRLVAENVTELIIPNCGHFVPEEASNEFTSAVLSFLEREVL
jgi:pimeloyl-ACP methyl ester carboxylesterase